MRIFVSRSGRQWRIVRTGRQQAISGTGRRGMNSPGSAGIQTGNQTNGTVNFIYLSRNDGRQSVCCHCQTDLLLPGRRISSAAISFPDPGVAASSIQVTSISFFHLLFCCTADRSTACSFCGFPGRISTGQLSFWPEAAAVGRIPQRTAERQCHGIRWFRPRCAWHCLYCLFRPFQPSFYGNADV